MRKICVSISKGGVAKSTSAVSIAHGLAMAGKRTLLIDTDDQGQAGFLLGIAPKHGLGEVLSRGMSPIKAMEKARPDLFLLSGGRELSGVKREIGRKDFGAERSLANVMESVAHEFEFIIIDTSPAWDALTINSLFFCNEVLMPVSLEVLSLNGLAEFTKRLDELVRFHSDLGRRYLVPTFLDGRVKKSKEILSILEKHYKPILMPAIRYCSRVAEATGFGKTIFEYAPRSTASQDYQTITKRILSS